MMGSGTQMGIEKMDVPDGSLSWVSTVRELSFMLYVHVAYELARPVCDIILFEPILGRFVPVNVISLKSRGGLSRSVTVIRASLMLKGYIRWSHSVLLVFSPSEEHPQQCNQGQTSDDTSDNPADRSSTQTRA